MKQHQLKTWPEYFEAVIEGRKTFEIRANDRNFKRGDFVELQEWCPDSKKYSGRSLTVEIKYVTSFNQMPGTVVFAFRRVKLKRPGDETDDRRGFGVTLRRSDVLHIGTTVDVVINRASGGQVKMHILAPPDVHIGRSMNYRPEVAEGATK